MGALYAKALQAQLAEAVRDREKYFAAFREEEHIVTRIWNQLGSPSYDELAGRSIFDMIDELKVRAEAASRTVHSYSEIDVGMANIRAEAAERKLAEAVKMLGASDQTLRLHMGEMTAQEMRTLKAGFGWVRTFLNSISKEPATDA